MNNKEEVEQFAHFINYLTEARNEFSKYMSETFPPGTGNTKTRVAAENILIAYDQVVQHYKQLFVTTEVGKISDNFYKVLESYRKTFEFIKPLK